MGMEVFGFFYRIQGWRSLVFLQDERMGMMGRMEVFGSFTGYKVEDVS
jgi:hypothetical protein